jgi:hypothetical protein
VVDTDTVAVFASVTEDIDEDKDNVLILPHTLFATFEA